MFLLPSIGSFNCYKVLLLLTWPWRGILCADQGAAVTFTSTFPEELPSMSWNTKITKLLGIGYPIIQGGMAYISDGLLAAAMNHAGCAGVIGSGGFSVDEIRDHIRQAKDILGPGKCFGVNLMLQMPNKDDVAQLICNYAQYHRRRTLSPISTPSSLPA